MFLRTQWALNPYILGSYSYVGVNCSAKKHINSLAEPIYVDKIVSEQHKTKHNNDFLSVK